MAQIIPDGYQALASALSPAAGTQREIETLNTLAATLPSAYRVYHAVHWTNLEHGFAVFGEIDFVVMNPAGDLLLIEQKSGFLSETESGLAKRYGEKSKSVPFQMARTVNAVVSKLRRRPGCEQVHVDALLYCPDYTVRKLDSAGVLPERIVDASRRERLAAFIMAALPLHTERPQATEVQRFLTDALQLEADVSVLAGRAAAWVTRIAGGLATWASRLELSPHRLRVIATAGSGKTQLALREYANALAQGKRPLYVCFNRPLADHFLRIAPAGGVAVSFHMLCDQLLRSAGTTPDFSVPNAFSQLVSAAATVPLTPLWQFDTVIIDEGQDFYPEWKELVLRHAKPEARVLWLEDPHQNLFDLPSIELPGWARLTDYNNYRSPRNIVQVLNTVLAPEPPIEACAPLAEADIDFIPYTDAAGLVAGVKNAIVNCLAAGFTKRDIALLSFRGREQSLLFPYTQLGTHTLRTFTGTYDADGQPLFSSGELLLETVYRFKGQSAPAIILAEIDFESLDEKARRKLFVGMTRAQLKLILVGSERAGRHLLAALS